MYSFQTPSSFNDFYDSVRSIQDSYEGYEDFGKKVSQPIFHYSAKRIVSIESKGGMEYYDSNSHRKWSQNSLGENDYMQPNLKSVQGYPYDNMQSMTTMASLTSLGSIQSVSSMQSLNGGSSTQHINSSVKSKTKVMGGKKKNCAETDFRMKYKTEVCKFWAQTGHCQFGDQCAFAHGRDEIRQKSHLSSNYKTKKCLQFHEHGFCPYGVRCQFLHSLRTETRLNPSLARQSYAEDLENVDIWHSRDPDCICMKRNKPRLPVFEKYALEEENGNQNQIVDKADLIKQHSPSQIFFNSQLNSDGIFSAEQSSDSSF